MDCHKFTKENSLKLWLKRSFNWVFSLPLFSSIPQVLFFGLGTGLLIKMIYKDELLTRRWKKGSLLYSRDPLTGTVGWVTSSEGPPGLVGFETFKEDIFHTFVAFYATYIVSQGFLLQFLSWTAR